MKRVAVHPEEPSAEAVGQGVAVLRGGGVIALPTETVYGLLADATNEEAVERLYEMKGRDEAKPCALLLGNTTAVLDHVPALPPLARRIAHRFWPGPVTLVVPGPAGRDVGLRLPQLPLPRAIAAAARFPIMQTSANHSEQAPALTADEVAEAFPEGLELLLDGGPVTGGIGSTVVRCDERSIEILRVGSVSEEDLLTAAVQRILMVCTGNLCRSPLAAALLERELARRLDCGISDLRRCGFSIASFGTMAHEGLPAAEETIAVGRRMDVELGEHSSRRFNIPLLKGARHVYCASRNHHDFLSTYFQRRPDDLELLDPDGKSIEDPFQQSTKVHRRVADQILAACRVRADELLEIEGTPLPAEAN